jgi:hypothetical protein
MARAKKIETPAINPAIEWTSEHQTQLSELVKLLEATKNGVEFLEAAKQHKISPQELSKRYDAAHAKHAATIAKMDARVKELGGHRINTGLAVLTGKGPIEDWKYYVPVNKHFGIGFEMNIIAAPMEYDQPIGFIPHILRLGKGKYKMTRSSGFNNSIEHDRLDRYDWMECAGLGALNKQITRLTKLANELSATLTLKK